jgi:V8-like Glu-specific endopeptidase
MKQVLALTTLVLAANSYAGVNVIYGKDNRQDLYQVSNSLHKQLAASTAAMVPVNLFKKSRQGFFDLQGVESLERSGNVCASEAFSQQPTPAICSGFLVGPDTLITAGHCYKSMGTPEQVCKSFAWVFDMSMKSASSNPLRDITVNNVYLCKQVVYAELSQNADFSVIKLDRPVVGRSPLKFRTSGKISDSANLVVIGHPTGLPTKVSPGGKITRNIDPTRFSTNLDTFHGNSGSAVFDANTGVVEGILIQGKTDYLPSKENDPRSCQVANVCDDNGNNCKFKGDTQGGVAWGEVVLRLNAVVPKIQQALSLKLK